MQQSILRVSAKKAQRGQGMTEYIIIVALIAFVLYGSLFVYHIVGMRATGLI